MAPTRRWAPEGCGRKPTGSVSLAISIATCDADLTARLLAMAQPMDALLATAAARTVSAWRRRHAHDTPPPLLALETHGRADVVVDDGAIDTSDTVGLLTAIYPLRIHSDGATDLARIPGGGIDYGLLRYLRADTHDCAVTLNPNSCSTTLGDCTSVSATCNSIES